MRFRIGVHLGDVMVKAVTSSGTGSTSRLASRRSPSRSQLQQNILGLLSGQMEIGYEWVTQISHLRNVHNGFA